jgi:hypothetical protein
MLLPKIVFSARTLSVDAWANLIYNGSFEVNDVHSSSNCTTLANCYTSSPFYDMHPYPPFPGWDFTDDINTSELGVAVFGSNMAAPSAPPDGSQYVFFSNAGNVAQPLTGLTTGESYTVTFWAAKGTSAVQPFGLNVNGVGWFDIPDLPQTWTEFQYTFVAAANLTTLTFSNGWTNTNFNSVGPGLVFLDAIDVETGTGGPVGTPEPGTAASLVGGMTGLWILLTRSRLR